MLPWIVVAVLLLGVVLLSAHIYRQTHGKERKCQNCRFWDHEAGQAALRRSPTFAQVMQVLTPNDEFGQKVVEEVPDLDDGGSPLLDDQGNPKILRTVKRLPVYSALENRWEYFGGCKQDDKVQHRTNTCDKFRAVP